MSNAMNSNVKKLFIVLFIHITLLDLLMVTTRGIEILMQPNLTIKTITVHIFIVSISCLVLLLVHNIFNKQKHHKSELL